MVTGAGRETIASEANRPSIAAAYRHYRRSATQGIRQFVIDGSPPWLTRAIGPLARYLDMLFVDHGIFRVVYLNKHRLGENAWRSAQPAPHQIRALARQGLRTIINLRGERRCGSYWLERNACERHGITLIDVKLRSRTPPTREQIEEITVLFARAEHPVLIHCKSGADRAGLASALYRHVHEGVPVELAKDQLSLRYGHVRQASTGVLDRFFEQYLEDTKQRPIALLQWVRTVYDPDALKKSFRTGWRTRRLLDAALRRE